ncbi:hypothetical protein CGLO_18201 [Colletotrichum gloeosporioides Cg-14]|uniref:Uncharacterized protein n=1 Tax=Colletotrichum gloeosporioides (strain Cg-14) TaxID=1237896 RepID=T0JUY5_COLGC|nr:hypothetical protein CGLO_18201 [Colletotrichum gloeosporioides Cg-14]
MAAPSHHS